MQSQARKCTFLQKFAGFENAFLRYFQSQNYRNNRAYSKTKKVASSNPYRNVSNEHNFLRKKWCVPFPEKKKWKWKLYFYNLEIKSYFHWQMWIKKWRKNRTIFFSTDICCHPCNLAYNVMSSRHKNAFSDNLEYFYLFQTDFFHLSFIIF